MDGLATTSPISLLRECFPQITQAQASVVLTEMERHGDAIRRSAVDRYVKNENTFSIASFLSVLRECAARARPAAPNDLAATQQLERRLCRAREIIQTMPAGELEEIKCACLKAIGPPLRDRLMRLPARECRCVLEAVAARVLVEK